MNLITQISDISLLTKMKERLKDDVMNPDLKWYERMELYKEIQYINGRIKKLHPTDAPNR